MRRKMVRTRIRGGSAAAARHPNSTAIHKDFLSQKNRGQIETQGKLTRIFLCAPVFFHVPRFVVPPGFGVSNKMAHFHLRCGESAVSGRWPHHCCPRTSDRATLHPLCVCERERERERERARERGCVCVCAGVGVRVRALRTCVRVVV